MTFCICRFPQFPMWFSRSGLCVGFRQSIVRESSSWFMERRLSYSEDTLFSFYFVPVTWIDSKLLCRIFVPLKCAEFCSDANSRWLFGSAYFVCVCLSLSECLSEWKERPTQRNVKLINKQANVQTRRSILFLIQNNRLG